MSKKIAFIYHSGDADGIMSALLFSEAFNLKQDVSNIVKHADTLELFPYNYEKTLAFENQLFEDGFTDIIFADCTPYTGWFTENYERLVTSKIQLTIFDHHKAAYEAILEEKLNNQLIELGIDYYYDDKRSASKIIFDNLFDEDSLSIYNKVFDSMFDFEDDIYHESDLEQLSCYVELVNSFDIWLWWDVFVETSNANPYIYYFGLFDAIVNLAKEADTTVQQTIINIIAKEKLIDFLNFENNNILELDNKRLKNEQYSAEQVSIVDKGLFVIVGSSVNAFTTKRIIDNFPKAEFVIYYRIDSTGDPQAFKLSLRSINRNMSVAKLSKNYFSGSGHHASAGGYISIVEFFKQIEVLQKMSTFKNYYINE
jgi:oligoribonuclease NrnB/cAMP/cGMP phosphodiesterase (DHH superfamily)